MAAKVFCVFFPLPSYILLTMNLALTAAQSLASEGAVIARGLKRRDTALIERLIEVYQHRIYRYLTYLTGSRERAEEFDRGHGI